MQVSAKVDYGIRALAVLGENYDSEPNRLIKGDAVAKSQSIPVKFLEAILTELRHSGFIISQRGAEGGYRLSRHPREIVLADIVRALDGPLAAVRGDRPEKVNYEGAAKNLNEVWLAVRVSLRKVLEQITLADVLSGNFEVSVNELLADPDARKSR